MNMIKTDIRRQLKSFVIWVITLAALDVMFMAFFPSMKSSGMSAIMKAKMNMIPKAMRTSFGMSNVDYSDLLQYFAFCWQYILLALCIFSAMVGANSLIKEESDGTIEFLYAEPVSRTKIAVCKLISTFSVQLFLNVVLFLVNVIILSVLRKSGYAFMGSLVKISLTSFYACTAFWAVGFAASSLLHHVSQASPFAMGVFFCTYIFGILAPLVKHQSFLKYLSPYHYVAPSDILAAGYLKTSYAVILAIIIVISSACGLTVYRKKDFRI